MRLTIASILLFSFLFSCLPEPQTSIQTIVLRQKVSDPSVNHRFYHPMIGWDSVPDSTSLIYLPKIGQAKGYIQVSDIVLNRRDSIRIGVIHPVAPIYDSIFATPQPDYLMLSSYGVDSVPISFTSKGTGPITRRTFFRVGRDIYRLASIDKTRSIIEIEPMKRGVDVEFAAEIDLRYKKVPLLTMDGRDTSIAATKGRDLILYFWGLGPAQGKDLVRLDSIYREVPLDSRPDIVAISRTDSKANLEKFLAENDLTIPVFQSTPETCSGLNCHSLLPYGLLVNSAGRIVNHNWRPWLLNGYLESLSISSR